MRLSWGCSLLLLLAHAIADDSAIEKMPPCSECNCVLEESCNNIDTGVATMCLDGDCAAWCASQSSKGSKKSASHPRAWPKSFREWWLLLLPRKAVEVLSRRYAKRLRKLQASEIAADIENMESVSGAGMTSFFVNFCRADEANAPVPLFEDPFSKLFTPAYMITRLVEIYWPLHSHLLKSGHPPLPAWVTMGSRTAYVDDKIRSAYSQGTRQVVLLGSGLDCRPMRLAKELPGVRFVEVDEPGVLENKVRVLEANGYDLLSQTTQIKGDYTKLDLCKELLDHGKIDPAEPILIIWEGNSMYMPASVGQDLLRKLLNTFSRATIVFDYLMHPVSGVAEGGGPPPVGDALLEHEREAYMELCADGGWLWPGAWDPQVDAKELGYTVVSWLDGCAL
ncbi:unnamed protein product [Chrysoparadoxa australica]